MGEIGKKREKREKTSPFLTPSPPPAPVTQATWTEKVHSQGRKEDSDVNRTGVLVGPFSAKKKRFCYHLIRVFVCKGPQWELLLQYLLGYPGIQSQKI